MFRRTLAMSLLATVALLTFLLRPAAAEEPPVLLVHGFDPSIAPAVDCRSMWKPMVDELRAQGRTRVLTVGYYAGDTNCDLKVGSFTLDTPIPEVARSLNNAAAKLGVVDVLGNSMGGVVVDYARAGGVAGEPGFARLQVRNMVLTGAPEHGTPLARLCVFQQQCRDMVSTSSFMTHLHAIAPRPLAGTDETNVSSVADLVVPWSSAQNYGAQHGMTYYTPGHADYVRAGGAQQYAGSTRAGTGGWHFATNQPSPARYVALALSSSKY